MNWRIIGLVAIGLGVVFAMLGWSNVGVREAVSTFFAGSAGSPAAVAGTLRETTPMLIGGIAVYIALKAGMFNIGVEGQLLVGAMTCAWIALRLPSPLGSALGIAGGMAAGALWALPAGLIKAYRGGHEVVTTIMLNAVALFATTALAAGPLKDPDQQSPSTASVSSEVRLPALYAHPPVYVSVATLVAAACALGLWWWLRRSVAGYELKAVGANTVAARAAGIDVKRNIVWSLAASGAVGGLAGAVQVLAYEGRFYAGMSSGYGFDALGVAILAGPSALAIIPSALLFGMLAKGGTSVQILGVPKGAGYVMLGLIILVASSVRYRGRVSDV